MARERYLIQSEEEGNDRSDVEKKPITPKSKWDNFWYYHKIHVIIAICLILLAGVLVKDLVGKVEPDYQIALITEQSYPEDKTEALQNEVAKYGEDLNADGRIVVKVSNYVVSNGTDNANVDMNIQAANYTRLSGDFQMGSSFIFITDDASFKYQQENAQVFSYLDGTTPKAGAVDYENMRISLKDCKKLNAASYGMENLSASLRIYKDTSIEGKKGMDAYFSASKKLFDKITSKQ